MAITTKEELLAEIQQQYERSFGHTPDLRDVLIYMASNNLAANVVNIDGDQDIDGIKTFLKSPILPQPTGSNQAATKKYVDDTVVASGGYTDAQAQNAIATILAETAYIRWLFDANVPSLTPVIKENSITELLLSASVKASLTKANNAQQPPAEGPFVDGDKAKLDLVSPDADVTDAQTVAQAGAVMKTNYGFAYSLLAQQAGTGNPTTIEVLQNTILGRLDGDIKTITPEELRALLNIENGATADQTGQEIKTLYELQPNTNAYTDAEKAKLAQQSGINTGDQDLSLLALDSTVVHLTGDETIGGNKTFDRSPILPSPSVDNHGATKKYVDDAIVASGGYTDEQAQDAVGVMLTSTDEIDLQYDDANQTVTANLKDESIIKNRLSTSVQSSLEKADSSIQTLNVSINTQSGNNYTLVLADSNKYIRCTNGASVAVTIPTNATVAFAIGTVITLRQAGAGQITVSGAGVTLNGNTKSAEQHASLQIIKVDTDTWDIIGGIA